MCLQKDFDISKAEEIIRKIDVNEVFKSSDFDLDTTLLSRAVDGANPHLKVEDDDLLQWALSNRGEDEGLQSDYRFEFINLLEKYDV